MTAYYNEFDPFAAAWLRELIKAGLIAPGDVDERSITDVRPEDLTGYTQCHFFAGIGGWSYALRLAGWPDSRPVWTGSCPCQPFSAAGKQQGAKDDRHLWPEFFRLIEARRPEAIFGEQVASSEVVGSQLEADFAVAVRTGKFAQANRIAKRLVRSSSFHYWPRWLDLVRGDMEAIGYAMRPEVLGAHSVGAPHIRQRLWFVAESDRIAGGQGRAINGRRNTRGDEEPRAGLGSREHLGELADAQCRPAERWGYDLAAAPCGTQGETREREWIRDDTGTSRDAGELADPAPQRCGEARPSGGRSAQWAGDGCEYGVALGDTQQPGLEGHAGNGDHRNEPGRDGAHATGSTPEAGATRGFWHPADWLPCLDGKARATQPGLQPLAHGVSARVGRLRGYGNAIVPQAAAEVIRTYMEY